MIFPAITVLLLAHLCSPQPVGVQAKRVQREAVPILKGQDSDPAVSLFVKEVERQGLALNSETPSGSRGRAFSEINGVQRKIKSPQFNSQQSPSPGRNVPTAFVHRTFGGFRSDGEHREESPQHTGHSTGFNSHPGGQLQAFEETSGDRLRNVNPSFNQRENSHSKDFVFLNQNSINPDINIIPDLRQSLVKIQDVDFHRKKTSSGNLLNLPQRPVVGFKLPIQNHFVSLPQTPNLNVGSENENDARKVILSGQSHSGHGKFEDFNSGHNKERHQHPTHILTSGDNPVHTGNSLHPIQSSTFNPNQLQFQQPIQSPPNNIHQTRFQPQKGRENADQTQHLIQPNNKHRNHFAAEQNFERVTKNNENNFQQNHFQRLNNEHVNNGQKDHFHPVTKEHGQRHQDFISHEFPPLRQTFPRESRTIFTENSHSAKHTFEPSHNSALNPKLKSHSDPQSHNQESKDTIISSGSPNPKFKEGVILRLQPSLILNDASSTHDFSKNFFTANNFPVDSLLPLEDPRVTSPHRSEGKLIKKETALQGNNPVKSHVNPKHEKNISSVNDFTNFRPSFFGRSLESEEPNVVPEGRSLGDDNPSLHTKQFAPGVWQGGFLPSNFFGPLST